MLSRRSILARATLTSALVASLLSVVPAPATVRADCGLVPSQPPTLAAATGIAFIGVPVARTRGEDVDGVRYEWQVERVFAGPVERGSLTVPVGPCTGAHPTLGRRYLVSAGSREGISSTSSLIAWLLRPDGSVRLDELWTYPDDDAAPRSIEAVRTATQALDLVAPGWSGRLPAAPDRRAREIRGRWEPMATAPFGATGAASAWTGSELVVAAGSSAAAWDPVTDTWRNLPPPPAPVHGGVSGTAAWTGSELLTWGPLGQVGVGAVPGQALDPATGAWRTLPPLPVDGSVVAAVWAADRVVVVTSTRETASYDPDTDTWTALRPLFTYRAQEEQTETWLPGRLVAIGSDVFVVDSDQPEAYGARIWQLEPETGGWWQPARATFYGATGATIADGRLLFAGRDTGVEESLDPRRVIDRFDPTTATWETRAVDCVPASGSGTWTGSRLLSGRLALLPDTGRCVRLPRSEDRARIDPVEVWTGRELVRWSGGGSEGRPAQPDGMRFIPDDPSALGMPLPGDP